jgi:hypothetical protein
LSDNISEICDPLGSIELTNVEEENLGILIEPAQVRLQTENTNDPYTWDRTEEKNHLFQKNISDHPIGKLKELSEGVVGKSIAAVAKKTAQRFHDGDVLSQVHCNRVPHFIRSSSNWEVRAQFTSRLGGAALPRGLKICRRTTNEAFLSSTSSGTRQRYRFN